MRTYVIRRLLLLIPTLFIVSLVVFFMMRLIPGTIVDAMVAMQLRGGVGSRQTANKAAIEHRLGLDVPMPTQFARWIGVLPDKNGHFRGLLQGSLGDSLWKETPVLDEIGSAWPVTVKLGILGLLIALLIALPIGVLSALRQDSWGDYLGRSFAIFCIAVPGFWVATMVIVFPSIWWGWSPPILLIRTLKHPLASLGQFVVPAIVLGMGMSGVTMRMTRTMMLEVLRQDYIRTAWSKGLRERAVILRHAIKNAVIPVLTIVGLEVPVLIGGTVIIEQIFSLPGMGRLLIDAIEQRDYPIVSGVVIFFSLGTTLINLAIDLIYAYLDPRIHYK